MVSRVLVGVPAVMPGLPLVLVAVLVPGFVVVLVPVLRHVLVPPLVRLATFIMLLVTGPPQALPRVGQLMPDVDQPQAVAGQPTARVPRGGRAERVSALAGGVVEVQRRSR